MSSPLADGCIYGSPVYFGQRVWWTLWSHDQCCPPSTRRLWGV